MIFQTMVQKRFWEWFPTGVAVFRQNTARSWAGIIIIIFVVLTCRLLIDPFDLIASDLEAVAQVNVIVTHNDR